MTRILTADDDFTIGMQIEEMLTALGYVVVGQAGSGQEAIRMTRDLKPDIILMDIVMPGELNGIKAAEKIKSEQDIPIVFISGHGESDYIHEAKQLEPYGYVMKPFDENEIKAVVEIALHKHKMEKELKQTNEQLERTNLALQMEIEARKKTEKALRESEERSRVIFEKSIQGILVVDLETTRFTYANPSICRMFGYSETEFLQLGVSDIHPKDSLHHVMSEFDLQRRGEKDVTADISCLRKNGTVFYADITSTGIIINHQECVVGFFADVTDRKRPEDFRE